MSVIFFENVRNLMQIRKMQKKLQKKCFVFDINASEFLHSIVPTNKGILVIRSQCVKKTTKEFSRL